MLRDEGRSGGRDKEASDGCSRAKRCGGMGQDPSAGGAHHALDQRARDPDHGDQRLADLQRFAAVRLHDSRRADARRVAGRRAAVALRGDVAARRQRAGVHRLRRRVRAFPAQAFPDHAARGAARRARGAARQARPRGSEHVQRGAARGLPRDHRRRHGAGVLRPRDLETGAAAGTDRADAAATKARAWCIFSRWPSWC